MKDFTLERIKKGYGIPPIVTPNMTVDESEELFNREFQRGYECGYKDALHDRGVK